MTIELTDKEVKALKEILSLDMDNIGVPDKVQETLNGISEKLTPRVKTHNPSDRVPHITKEPQNPLKAAKIAHHWRKVKRKK
jgi:hypothetical protein